ncbi:MAG: FAD-binding oxidoreductase [Prosthecochloris sp.]|nr:FAD-binding oxidoreductase [Prosthecochloris sp.]
MKLNENPEQTRRFLEDTSNIRTGHTPGVYLPENTAEVRAVVREAAERNRRLTISGNGTGTTGGRIPFGDYVIAMEKLDHIGDVRPEGKDCASITVGAGALLDDIQNKVQDAGWLYPPDPTEKLCFIGSTIANNSSGARTFKYGPTRHYINRLEVVLATGELLDIRRGECRADSQGNITIDRQGHEPLSIAIPRYTMPSTSKHNAGYYSAPGMDLIDLFIGSEGTLGIITEAELRLIPLPEQIVSFLVYFDDIGNLFRFLDRARKRPGNLDPRALEMFEKNALDFLSNVYPDIPRDAAGAVFLEQEATAATEDGLLDEWFGLMEACHAMTEDSWVALDAGEQRKMKEFRHELPVQVNEWLSRQQESKISTDMAVPEEAFAELFRFYRDRCEHHGFHYIIFGHAGNGHVHLNILPENHQQFLEAKELYITLVRKALELGGTLSAEHGIGKLKAGYMPEMFGREGMMEMVRVKKALDPGLMLNTGNLIAPEFFESD